MVRVVKQLFGTYCNQVVHIQRLPVDVWRLQNLVRLFEDFLKFLALGVDCGRRALPDRALLRKIVSRLRSSFHLIALSGKVWQLGLFLSADQLQVLVGQVLVRNSLVISLRLNSERRHFKIAATIN
jgi:hypothetical protein